MSIPNEPPRQTSPLKPLTTSPGASSASSPQPSPEASLRELESPEAPAGKPKRKGSEKGKQLEKAKGKDNQLGSKRGVETLFRVQYPLHMDLSALADAKSNIMISINGIMISILLASISPKIDANPWLLVPTAILLLGCLGSMVFAILAALPRVTRTPVTLQDFREGRANILFFGNFVRLSRRDYVTGMSELLQTRTRLYTSMMEDIHSLGKVLDRKFYLLRISYLTFLVALIIGVVVFISVFFFVANSPELTNTATGAPNGLFP